MKSNVKKQAAFLVMLLYFIFGLSATVFAAAEGNSAISAPLNTLLSLVADVVTGIGAIITLYGIFEFGNAQQSQDGAAKSFAIQRITGGLIMVVAPQLLQLFVA